MSIPTNTIFAVSYGDFDFHDTINNTNVPSVSIDTEILKTQAGDIIGVKDNIKLNGVIWSSGKIPFSGADHSYSIASPVWYDFHNAILKLEQNFTDYKTLSIMGYCTNNKVYTSDPKATYIESIDFSNKTSERWDQGIDFEINISVYRTGEAGKFYFKYFTPVAPQAFYVNNISDSFSISQVPEYGFYSQNTLSKYRPVTISLDQHAPLYTITRTVSAEGIWTSGNTAIDNARYCVNAILSNNSRLNVLSNLDVIHSTWNTKIDDTRGEFQVTQTIIAASGSGISNPNISAYSGWAETFTINTSINEKLLRTVTIDGKVQGFYDARTVYDPSFVYSQNYYNTNNNLSTISGVAFAKASGGFFRKVEPEIYNRILGGLNYPTGSITGVTRINKWHINTGLNPLPTNRNVTFNFAEGSIDYSYVFDSRPLNLISGSIRERIEMVDTLGVRSVVTQNVLGRMPIPQDMGTYSMPSRTATYTATFPTPIFGTLPVNVKNQLGSLMEAFNPAKLTPLSSNTTFGPGYFSVITASGENYDVLGKTFTLKCTWNYWKGYYPEGFYGG
jgi:hypothetical protein